MTEKEFTKHLKENQDRLIIFGTGEHGERMVKSLQQNEIVPVCFCDNNKEKIGKELESVRICSFDEVKKQYKNPIFLISPYLVKFQTQIIQQIKSADFSMLSYYTISYFYQHIEEAYIKTPFEKNQLSVYKNKRYETVHTDYLYTFALTLLITHKCTLNCRDCVQFIPYHKNKQHYDKEVIFSYLDKLDEIYDFVTVFRIHGGEPFMHPDLFEILEYAQKKESFKTILVTTNGTILPDREKFAKLDPHKVHFLFSNYGSLSNKMPELIALFDQLEFAWEHHPLDKEWFDCSVTGFRNKPENELQQMYKSCAHICIQITDGKLFTCSNIGTAGYMLGIMPKDVIEYVDFMDPNKTIAQLREEMRVFLYGMDYFKGCNWCTGYTESEQIPIPPAIQTTEKLNFKKIYD